MAGKNFHAASLVLLAGTALAARQWRPVMAPDVNVDDRANYRPTTAPALHYGFDGASYVNVTFSMDDGAVLLEQIANISSIACTNSSVTTVFNDTSAFNLAASEWLAGTTLITNHMGNCDVADTRGFFKAQSFDYNNSTLTIVASSQNVTAASQSSNVEMTFANVPVSTKKAKRITISDSLTVSGNLTLNDKQIFSEDDVTLTADEVYLGTSITVSGYLNYKILSGSLKALYFDIDTTLEADLDLDLAIEASYDNTFSYTAPALEYVLVDIPGIINIGPALTFEIGVELDAVASIDVNANLGAKISDGNIHLDIVNEGSTTTSGWTPTYTATVNVTEEAQLQVNPFIDLGVEFECKVLDGVLDLSCGVTAEPKFVNTFTLEGSQSASVSGKRDTTCSNGFTLNSTFEFELDAFATQWWSTTLYSTSVPIADMCYTWA